MLFDLNRILGLVRVGW